MFEEWSFPQSKIHFISPAKTKNIASSEIYEKSLNFKRKLFSRIWGQDFRAVVNKPVKNHTMSQDNKLNIYSQTLLMLEETI